MKRPENSSRKWSKVGSQSTDRESLQIHGRISGGWVITYVVKASPEDMQVFTREGGQLEAYCSGIGKILLAALSPDSVEKYLLSGPFPKLTDRTITDPKRISRELNKVRRCGYAEDSGEVADGLYCVAVPICAHDGEVIAATSASSFSRAGRRSRADRLQPLLTAAENISKSLGFRA